MQRFKQNNILEQLETLHQGNFIEKSQFQEFGI